MLTSKNRKEDRRTIFLQKTHKHREENAASHRDTVTQLSLECFECLK
jgi:hypothetical protein